MALTDSWPQQVWVPNSTWDLGGYAEPPSEWGLSNLVETWQQITDGFGGVATFLEGLGATSLSDWIGESGSSFDQHRRELIKDLDECAAAAGAARGVVEEIEGLFQRNNGRMEGIFQRLADQLESTGARYDDTWNFVLRDEADEQILTGGLDEAAQLKRTHAGAVRSAAGRLDPSVWEGVSARWRLAVNPPPYIPDPYRSSYLPFEVPRPSGGTHVYVTDLSREPEGGTDRQQLAWVVSTDTFASDIQVVPSEQDNEEEGHPLSYTVKFDDKEIIVPWGERMVIQSNGQMYSVRLTGNSPERHRQVWGDDVPFEPPAIHPY